MENQITAALQSRFLRLYQMACADEDFDTPEMKQLYLFAEQRGVETSQLEKILTNPLARISIPETRDERVEYLYDLAVMTWADKEVTDDEYNTLQKFCRRFQFEDTNIDSICSFLLNCAEQEMTLSQVLTKING
ncbi:hypothetical protein [Pedobacter montanisoli]|uniref:TerB family tellurite resistance protein n=1 Tax=Pedobacter montanisoli TaxID=2923277 RepID=A0ABS9ZV30_9SPHI|nr:hypothetical protein [Pedobacter montanisoli]MCJ0742222.1 hypothetical protein [Pedobacter montanisoli]